MIPVKINTTASDRFSGHGFSGNDRFSGRKTPDILLMRLQQTTFLVETTVLVEFKGLTNFSTEKVVCCTDVQVYIMA